MEETKENYRLELKVFVVMGANCIGSCKSNYHMITSTVFLAYYSKTQKQLQNAMIVNIMTPKSIMYITILERWNALRETVYYS